MFEDISLKEQEAIIKLYVAIFARAPETSGANYWAGEFQKLDSAMSVDEKMDSIADRMLTDSYVFNATVFSADMPLEDFIKQMYLNALGRGEAAFSALGRKAAPTQDEIAYWVDEISSGRVTKAGFGLRIFRDSEIFAEGGTASSEDIAKYKFQSAFNATRLAISKEFVKQENSGELQSDRAIIAGREILKGVPMIRLEGEALSQYISRKLAWPEDPSLYERVPPLSASSLVAEITAEEAAAVGGSLPTADSPFTDLSPATGSGAAPAGGSVAAFAAPAALPAQQADDGGGAVQRAAFDQPANGGPGDNDTLHLTGNVPPQTMIDLRLAGDQISAEDQGGAVQQNFENVNLSEVKSHTGVTIIAHDNGATITGSKNNDVITGGAGNDTLNGGKGGNDLIKGGAGADTLTGGAGNDIFYYNAGDSGFIMEGGRITAKYDTIMDFATGANKLRFVDDTEIMANGTVAGLVIASGKITAFSAGAADLQGKIAAIRSDARFDAVKKIAFFEQGVDTYVYHTGDDAAHDDDIIIKLQDFEADRMAINEAKMVIAGTRTDYVDVSFA